MIHFDFDAPDTKSGFCPICESKADIWCSRDGVWHCTLCNWCGSSPRYTITKAARNRHEQNRRQNT